MTPASVFRLSCAALCAACCLGCSPPGRPGPYPEVPLPDQVTDFSVLYKQNCAGCHGAEGKNGAAVSLADPVYLAMAGPAHVRLVTASGIPGSLMPPFAKSAGGTLTDRQIDILAQGIFHAWSRPNLPADPSAPPYDAAAPGDPARGRTAFIGFCARCHGAEGKGAQPAPGSIVDPSYLALVSDRGLRSTIVAGRPDEGMPDWRSERSASGSRALSAADVADIVAWLSAQRTAAP